jgi:hypothetical protein
MRAAAGLGIELALRAALAPGLLAARWLAGEEAADADAPAAPRSLAGAARMALDEAFFLSEVVTAAFVGAADGRRLGRETAEAEALFAARGWLEAPATYHPAPPPLDAPALLPARSLGRPYGHLVFDSGYAPHPGEPGRERWLGRAANRTAHAWVLEHPGRPRPWLVCLHGYRTGYPLADFVQFPPAWLHERLGLNVLVPVLPLHGPRTAGRRSGEGFFSGDVLDTLHLQAQAVWDVRRLLGWLRAREAPAVGLYGLSLGGAIAALLAALEAELDCVVVGMPAVDLVHLARRHVPAPVRALAARLGFAWDAVARLLRVTSPLALAPRVACERRFLFGGLADRLVPPGQICALWRHWERPRLAWLPGGHVSLAVGTVGRALVEEALAATGLLAHADRR